MKNLNLLGGKLTCQNLNHPLYWDKMGSKTKIFKYSSDITIISLAMNGLSRSMKQSYILQEFDKRIKMKKLTRKTSMYDG